MKKPRQFSSTKKCAKNIFLSALLLLLALPTYGQLDCNDTLDVVWAESTNLSEAKSRMGAASLGTKAYFAGGSNCITNLDEVVVYDTDGSSWETLPQGLSVARGVPAGVACNGKVFFAGGYISSPSVAFFKEVDIYDPAGDSWAVDSLSVPRQTGAVANDSIVIFAGGIIAFGVTTDIVDIYNTNLGDWVTTPTDKLSKARRANAAVVVGDLAIFAGGFISPGNVSDRVDIYDFSNGQWSDTTLSEARAFIAATVVGDKAFFAGGADINGNSDVVDIYDASTGEWSTANLDVARAFLGSINAGTVCDKAFFVGGANYSINNGSFEETYSRIDIYDSKTGDWLQEDLEMARANHAVVAVGDTLLVAGGKDDPCLSSVEMLQLKVGVSSLDAESDYTIYPNPAKDELIINATFKNQTSGTLSLFDIMGRALYQYKFDESMLKHQIDLSSFSIGIYLIEIKTDRESYVEKVMILE